jgi:hypothetical protein
VAIVLSLSDALETKLRSGVYSFCYLSEKNVPLSFELYTRCRLFNVIHSSRASPLLSLPSYPHAVLWLLKSPIYIAGCFNTFIGGLLQVSLGGLYMFAMLTSFILVTKIKMFSETDFYIVSTSSKSSFTYVAIPYCL